MCVSTYFQGTRNRFDINIIIESERRRGYDDDGTVSRAHFSGERREENSRSRKAGQQRDDTRKCRITTGRTQYLRGTVLMCNNNNVK